jgi:hypothetical protein
VKDIFVLIAVGGGVRDVENRPVIYLHVGHNFIINGILHVNVVLGMN